MMAPIPAPEPPRIETDAEGRRIYRPDGETLRAFLRANGFVDIIRGPIGSGTSSACCMKVFMRMTAQRPGPDGIRRTRWVVIRSTYPELKNTTVKTWLYWFPENLYGRFVWERPFRHEMKFRDVEAEVIFMALDDETSIPKLRSLELTGLFGNEIEFVDKPIIDEALSRCGRYPPVAEGGASWYGGICDTNAPGEDHWLPMMMGEVPLPEGLTDDERRAFDKPAGWNYFVQPPALLEEFGKDGKPTGRYLPNPAAENTKWLPADYYMRQIAGKRKSWVDSRVMNRITVHAEGDPVFPMFRPDVHLAKEALKPVPGQKLVVGLDFGRRPAAAIMQRTGSRWAVLSECGAVDVGATTFAPILRQHLAERYPDWRIDRGDVLFWGDPKGQDKVQADERTAYDIFQAHGMMVRPAPVPTNNIQTRLEAIDGPLMRFVDGHPGLLVSPSCRTLKVAFGGGYHWRKIGDGRTEPNKDRYSDYMDALGYGLLGGGEVRAAAGRGYEGRPAKAQIWAAGSKGGWRAARAAARRGL